MKSLSEYNISYTSLKLGKHEYNYLVEHSFFKEFPFSPVKEGRVWVHVSLSKHETMMVLQFTLKGTVNVCCCRCNDHFDLEIEGENKLIVKFGETAETETDDILVLPFGEHELNIAQAMYEFILLCIPIKILHPLDKKGKSTCNPEVLSVLQKLSARADDTSDPRWEALNKLKKLN